MSDNSKTGSFNKNKERFAVFLRNTDQKKVQVEATLTGLRQNAPKLWERFLLPNQDIRILSVGAGNGGFEIPLVKTLLDMHGSKKGFKLSCEDISPTMKREFIKNAEKAELLDVLDEYKIAPFDDDSYVPPTANFVLSSHVWYYIKNWSGIEPSKNTLTKFHSAISKEGIGLIILHSEKSDRYTLLKHSHDITGNEEPERHGEQVIAELRSQNIKNHSETTVAHTNVSSCFLNGSFAPSDEGKLLLSFILRTDWKEIPVSTQKAVGMKLEEIVQKNGKYEMAFRDLCIWIFP